MSTLAYEMRSASEIKPSPRNARKHSKAQINQVASSIKEFGFINPIVIDGHNRVMAGHARLSAALQLGYAEVPCLQAKHLSDDQIRAYMLADNKIAENATWDDDLLRVELEYLCKIDLDVDVTGFIIPEVDIILGRAEPQLVEVIDEALLDLKECPVTQPGDVWQLGPHRIACGDLREAPLLTPLMGGELARMVFTDPPYNVKVDGHVGGLGAVKHEEFVMASGEMSDEEFANFLLQSCTALRDISQPGSLHYICMDWRHLDALLSAGEQIFDKLLNLCVWTKTNAGMGSLYRSQHEMVLVFKHGTAPHINNVQLGKNGRYRTNVWQYPGVNSFSKDRDATLAMHPTVKPTQLVADAILDVTKPGDLVFDGFLGSGTTILAAEKTHRRCYGVDIDPRYVDVALARWIDRTGEQPIHLASGETFEARSNAEVADVE